MFWLTLRFVLKMKELFEVSGFGIQILEPFVRDKQSHQVIYQSGF
jgi:hypothetical protein